MSTFMLYVTQEEDGTDEKEIPLDAKVHGSGTTYAHGVKITELEGTGGARFLQVDKEKPNKQEIEANMPCVDEEKVKKDAALRVC
jgi:hypothetical protein